MGSIVLLDLMGGVALLLWGLHMVRSGIMRAFGSELRRLLSTALQNRLLALLAGIGVTALLQSSTATALMITSFAGRGLVDLVPALAIMLGANIGTTLIVQVLSFNVSAVAPVLFLVGVVAFKLGQRTPTRDLGRVAIGLGLMLLALHILLDTLAPAENVPSVRALLGAITGEPILCILIAAHDLDSGFSSPVTLQSNFIGELTNGYRKSRGSMCAPIWRRRTLMAAYSEEHRCLLNDCCSGVS